MGAENNSYSQYTPIVRCDDCGWVICRCMKKKIKLPRAPLPRQTGGAHKDKKKSDPKHKPDYERWEVNDAQSMDVFFDSYNN